eukprot:1158220-Pelagomonas_calceolata.AAC.13
MVRNGEKHLPATMLTRWRQRVLSSPSVLTITMSQRSKQCVTAARDKLKNYDSTPYRQRGKCCPMAGSECSLVYLVLSLAYDAMKEKKTT